MKKSIIPLVISVISILLLSGCPAIIDIIDNLSAADAASGYGGKLPVNSGGRQYVIQNKIENPSATQTVAYFTENSNFNVTQQTGSSTTLPVSFPSIFIGNNNGHATLDSGLPKITGTISSIPTTWTWSNANAPSADFAAPYELWFTETLNNTSITDPDYSLNIWLYKPAGHSPGGAPSGFIVINGMPWNMGNNF